MAQIEHLPASSSVDEINAVLERDGAVIIDDVLALGKARSDSE